MTKSDRSLESLCSGKIRLFYPLLSIITFKCNILVFFKIIIWTMAVLTVITTITAVIQVSAVEMCFTTLSSVGRTSLSSTATFYQLEYSLRSCRQSRHHRKPFGVLQRPVKGLW